MIAATAVAALLHRWTGSDDVTFGCPVANRPEGPGGDVVGPCMNTVVLRSRVDETTTMGDLLAAMSETVLDALNHRQAPFEDVVDQLRPPRRPGVTPYADVFMTVEPASAGRPRLGDLELAPVELAQRGSGYEAKVGLGVLFREVDGTLRGTLAHRGDRVLADDARQMARLLGRLLDRLPDALGEPLRTIDLVDAEERETLVRFERGPAPAPPTTVPELLGRRLRAAPDSIALLTGRGALTCRELEAGAAAVAAALRPWPARPIPSSASTWAGARTWSWPCSGPGPPAAPSARSTPPIPWSGSTSCSATWAPGR